MRGNAGGYAIRAVGAQTDIGTCLLADNTVSAALISLENSGQTTIDGCTMANNAIGGAGVIYSVNKRNNVFHYFLENSIVAQPGVATLAYGDASTFSAIYVLTNDTGSFSYVGNSIVQGTPTFVNSAAGDYRLQFTSLGVDFAPISYNGYPPNTPIDLQGMPRVLDLAGRINVFGPRDLGAYETVRPCYHLDTLFCDGLDP